MECTTVAILSTRAAVPKLSSLAARPGRKGRHVSGMRTHASPTPFVGVVGAYAIHSCEWSFVRERRVLALVCKAPSCEQQTLALTCGALLTQMEGTCASVRSSIHVSRGR